MKLSIPEGEDLQFSHDVPPELARFKAPGTVISVASGPYGTVLLQGLPPKDMKAWHGVYRIYQDTPFNVTTSANGVPIIKMRLLIKTDQLMEIKGLGDIYLREGQANLLYSPTNEYTQFYKKGKEYIAIDIDYSMDWLTKWRQLFPALENFVRKIEANEPAVLTHDPLRLTGAIFSIVHDIIYCPYDQIYHKLFFDNKASLLLFLLLVQTIQPVKDEFYGTDHVDKILRAKSLITTDERYHYSIPQIAHEVGLTEVKLKAGFKQLFGTGIYGFLVKVRMIKAKELLENTSKTVKEIGDQVGYRSNSSFIRVFKGKFGHSPFNWRRLYKAKQNGRKEKKK